MTPRAQEPRRERGFTLVEIMVVVVIIGLLATLVVPNVLGYSEQARLDKAASDVNSIHGTVTVYWTRNGTLPSMDDLLEPDSTGNPYLETEPIDPWKNPYEIRSKEGRGRFEVISYGPDGIADTDDDITYPKRDET